jgi:hypothetical protein
MESKLAACKPEVYSPRTRKRYSMKEKPTKRSSTVRCWIAPPTPTHSNLASEKDRREADHLKRSTSPSF